MVAAVEKIPQFGPLVFRVPLPEVVPVREEALLGPRLFLVAPPAAETGGESVFLDGVEKGDGLQGVAGGVGTFLFLDATSFSAKASR
jgi:hypothetical protein